MGLPPARSLVLLLCTATFRSVPPVGVGRLDERSGQRESPSRRRCRWELVKNIFPGRPSRRGHILLNGLEFEIIGVLDKIGREGNNGSNARIFVPIETMRMLFPLKGDNAVDSVSFLNYRPADRERHVEARMKVTPSSPAITDSIQNWKTLLKTGHD